jgi:site-specific DNA-methyltransferase (adenine-specific)
MTVNQHLRLRQQITMPQKAFNHIVSGISVPLADLRPYYEQDRLRLYNDDCLEVLSRIPEDSIDMIFADPPYMLSNDGFTCQNGRNVFNARKIWFDGCPAASKFRSSSSHKYSSTC